MDVWAPVFSHAEAAAAAGVQVEKVRVWFSRGHLSYAEGDEAGSGGLAARLSARTALRVAIVGALTTIDVVPAIGNAAALAFMDLSHADPVTNATRLPGELFAIPETVLCVYPDGSSAIHHAPLRKGLAFDLRIGADGVRHAAYKALALDILYRDVLAALEAIERDWPSAPRVRSAPKELADG